MKEYVRKLFRVYRKRYGNNQKLLRSDEDHPFWAVETGQPICSRRTIYNIEEGNHQVNEDTIAFLIGKMGYVYHADEKVFDWLVSIADQIRDAIIRGDAAKVKSLKEQTEALNYRGVFLFELYMQLINITYKVYLEADFAAVEEVSLLRYEKDLFPQSLQYLMDYCLIFYDLFVRNDFIQVNNGIRKLSQINEDDLLLMVIAQSVSEDLIINLSSYLHSRISSYENLRKKRLTDLLKITLESYLLYWGKAGQSDPLQGNRMICRIRELRDFRCLPYLEDLKACSNPLLNCLYLSLASDWACRNHRYKILAEIIKTLIS